MLYKTSAPCTVILSDLHIGSTVALWPDKFVSEEDVPVGQNRFQKLLWKQWKKVWPWISEQVGDRPFNLVLNGDLVEGIHHRSKQVMTADTHDQSKAVMMVLGPLAEQAHDVYVAKGTECHTRNDEHRISEVLGSVRNKENGQSAHDHLFLKLPCGNILSVTHHIPTTQRPYLEGSQYSIQLGAVIQECARNKMPVPTIIARAHRHVPGHFCDLRGMAIITGAWQGLTRFGYKVATHATVPCPSVALLDSDDLENDLPRLKHKRFV